jgi:CheY-like chemotaxis protein
MTTQALPEDVAMALESGMNAHVKKPISLDELLRTLREYL